MNNGLYKLEQKRVYPPASFYFRTKEDIERFKQVFFDLGIYIPWVEPIHLGPINITIYSNDIDMDPEERAMKELSWAKHVSQRYKEIDISEYDPYILNMRVEEIMEAQREEIRRNGFRNQMDRYNKISGRYGNKGIIRRLDDNE